MLRYIINNLIFTNGIEDDQQDEKQSINDLHFFQVVENLIAVLLKNLVNSLTNAYSGPSLEYIYCNRYLSDDRQEVLLPGYLFSLVSFKEKNINCIHFVPLTWKN